MSGPGLPHQRYHSQDFAAAPRVSVRTLLYVVVACAVLDYFCLVIGIHIGRDLDRQEHVERELTRKAASTRPVYGLRQYQCTASERHEYLEACKRRLHSNLTGEH